MGIKEAGEHGTVAAGTEGASHPPTQAHPLNPGSCGLHGVVLCCPVSGYPAWQWTMWKPMIGKLKISALPTQSGPVMGLSLPLHIPVWLTTPFRSPGQVAPLQHPTINHFASGAATPKASSLVILS